MLDNLLKKHSNQTAILLFFYIIFLFIRAPDILTQGRFWAEEGYIFYSNAYNMSFFQALFVVYGGYINIGASGITLIARYLFIPLEYAPYITIAFGLLCQITPIYILLTAKDQWLSPFYVRFLGTLLLLLVPESSEISLQSLHLQFHLTLACVLIAFLNTDIENNRRFKLCVLFFAPLCGLLPIALIPIFLFQLYKEKDKLRFEQTLAFILGCSIQLSFYIFNLIHKIDIDTFAIVRQRHFSYYDFCNIFYVRDLVFPFLGHRSIAIMANIFHKVEIHQISIKAYLLTSLFIILCAGIFIKYRQTRRALILFISALLMLCMSIYGVAGTTLHLINPLFTERYAFLPQALLVLMLLYFSVTLPKWGKVTSNILIIWLICVGSVNFFQLLPEAKDGAGHVWRKELKKWRENPEYNPRIWASGWYIVIPKKLYDSSQLQKTTK